MIFLGVQCPNKAESNLRVSQTNETALPIRNQLDCERRAKGDTGDIREQLNPILAHLNKDCRNRSNWASR